MDAGSNAGAVAEYAKKNAINQVTNFVIFVSLVVKDGIHNYQATQSVFLSYFYHRLMGVND